MRSLLIGCGNSRAKKIYLGDAKEWVGELTTLDMNPDCGADIVMDLADYFDSRNWPTVRNVAVSERLPFPDEHFDEIGAYDSLEHWGQQGDWKGWFGEMTEYHRILKPGGTMGIIVPIGDDALADPGHTRFFGPNHFHMLSQQWYADSLAKGLQVTDYRWYYKANFDIATLQNVGDHHLAVMLRKA